MVRWFFADDDAKQCPSPHWFGSKVWDEHKGIEPPVVGDLEGRRPAWADAGNTLGYAGVAACGAPAVWHQLGFLNHVPPLMRTRPDGTLSCCDLADIVADGGLGVGGGANWANLWPGQLPGGGYAATARFLPVLQPGRAAGGLAPGVTPPIPPILYFGSATGGGYATSLEVLEVLVPGMMVVWPDATPPAGWLLVDGSTFSGVTYPNLAAVIGAKFGPIVGTNYRLPDAFGRVYVSSGAGGGLTPRNTGDSGGAEGVQLTGGESGMPAHSHTLQALNAGPPNILSAASDFVRNPASPYNAQVLTTVTGPLAAALPHENMQPFVCLGYWIIKT